MSNPSAVEDIFLAALEKGSPEQRAAFLDSACQGDADLRRRIERLLEAHAKAGSFLEQPVRHAEEPEEFGDLLSRVVEHLETMPAAERLRWLELLSYLEAMIYHDRERSEHERLKEVILASVRTDEHRQELQTMRQSMADVHREEGRKEGAVLALRSALLRQLRGRFGKVPKSVERTITATDDLARLDAWLVRFATATTLDEVGIKPEG